MRRGAALGALLAAGCSSAEELTLPPYRPDAADLARAAESDAGPAKPPAPSPREEAAALLAKPQVSLDDVLRAVEAVSPEIEAARDDVLAASGRAWQAGLHPNPALEFAREGPLDDRPWGRTQFTVGVRQPVVVSERRKLAASAELADREARALTVAEVRREVRGAARAAFVEVVYLRDTAALHRELLAVAQQLLDLAKARVEAKVAVAPEALKPELEVVTLRAALTGFERRRDAARDHLSALLGGIPVQPDRLTGGLPPPERDLAALVRRTMEKHPALLVARQEADAARERLELARTASRPDLDVRVAVGRDFDEDDFVAELGVDIPLAVFDAGQGRIFEARALASKARRDAESLERSLAAAVTARFGEAESARAELRDVRERILPLAERTLAVTRDAYQSGTQEFLDVLDAQRTLLEARAAALALERDAALADAEVVTLSGDLP